MVREWLHTDEEVRCPYAAPRTGDIHLERHCEDCDVFRMSRCTPGDADHLYHTGRIGQDFHEAYRHAYAVLSPAHAMGAWRARSDFPRVRRIVRKIIRTRGHGVPPDWEESVREGVAFRRDAVV